jgi:hypothetical protein
MPRCLGHLSFKRLGHRCLGGSVTLDKVELTVYHSSAKSGWTSWSLNCESFLFLPLLPPTTVLELKRQSCGQQPIPLGVGTMLRGCSNINGSGILNESIVRGPQNVRAAVYSPIYVRWFAHRFNWTAKNIHETTLHSHVFAVRILAITGDSTRYRRCESFPRSLDISGLRGTDKSCCT